MHETFDIKDNCSDRFADYSNVIERFCSVMDKNIFLLVKLSSGAKRCFNYTNCKKKDTCKFIKQ